MARGLTALILIAGLMCLGVKPVHAVDEGGIEKSVKAGVEALKKFQKADGTWPHTQIGATALAGLALMECGVKPDEDCLKAAAKNVRENSMFITQTYSIALSLLFLDRLDNPADVPLIESLGIRLLAGQNSAGGWGYYCPKLDEGEIRRLTTVVKDGAVLKGRKGLGKLPPKGKRTTKDLSKEARAQLVTPPRNKQPELGIMPHGDNSNTQFAMLAVWVGRRYGLPAAVSLKAVDTRFRRSQNPDSGWGYLPSSRTDGLVRIAAGDNMHASKATMTCAGLLALALGHGVLAEADRTRDPKIGKRDISKDRQLRNGLQTLSTAIGAPSKLGRKGKRLTAMPTATGRAYYFLWSLERVGVALDLKTIGKKDWYAWGSELLLANQQADGSWRGEFADCGADTAFALLFLKQANLARDLTANIRGLGDPGGKVLKAGGVGGNALKGDGGLKMEGIGEKPEAGVKKKPEENPKTVDKRPGAKETASRLGRELIAADATGQRSVLKKLRDGKGSAYTEALATAIPRLDGAPKRDAREALADRLARMSVATLQTYLADEQTELRLAAVRASAAKESKLLVPNLIGRLSDADPLVARLAQSALKQLTKQDFGPKKGATAAEKSQAIAAWRRWWSKQTRD
jgi:hypothetical protein